MVKTEMNNKVMYFGREVKAVIPRSAPMMVMIDVMQKETDCPYSFPLEERMKCPCDCQNTFLSFVYSIIEKRIIGMGALSSNVDSYIGTTMKKHGISTEEAQRIVREGGEKVTFKREFGKKDVFFKGDLLMQRAICQFNTADLIVPTGHEAKQYFDLITSDPLKIMKECGVELKGEGGLELVVYRDSRNRVDL